MSISGGGEFKRDLSVYALLAMSLGTVIGSGWLLLPGIVASQAGPASVFSWIIAGLMMLVVAAVYSELGATWPAPGAVAKYPHMSHGQFVGHMAGWAAFIAYVVTPPAEAVAVVRYAGSVWPALVSGNALTPLGIAVAILILFAISLLCYTSVKYLGIFETYVTALKYIPIAIFLIFIPLFAFHPVNFTKFGGFTPTGGSGILVGTASTLFAFIGFRQALDFGAEAKNPGRDLPRAVLGTILIATVTYILISIVFIGGINWSGLSKVKVGQWSTLANLPSPMYNLAAASGIGIVAAVLLADGIISPNGPNASNVGTVPRITYTMAEDGTMPKIFLRLHPKYGTPDAGLLIAFVIEVGFLFVTAAGYSTLIDVVNAAFAVGFATGPVVLVTLRRTAPHVNRLYTLRGG
ncbi:MAG TPA: APC family permease, partial [Methanomicrobiales archaeon]|nr:APC family permease [Methanomicrobiales archaeon]